MCLSVCVSPKVFPYINQISEIVLKYSVFVKIGFPSCLLGVCGRACTHRAWKYAHNLGSMNNKYISADLSCIFMKIVTIDKKVSRMHQIQDPSMLTWKCINASKCEYVNLYLVMPFKQCREENKIKVSQKGWMNACALKPEIWRKVAYSPFYLRLQTYDMKN